MGVYSEILGQRIAAFQRESDYLPDSVKLVDPDVDYEIHLSEKFVRDADGTLWCRKCGEQAEGLLPGGERDTLSDGYPFCENCVFSDPDNDPTLNIPLSEEEEKEWLR
jgi:sugar lactone lactonase YvrE